MSEISTATASWLTLRAAADGAARSRRLAVDLARLLPPGRVVLHDLGTGTGGMPRWLAPLLPGPQEWVLHDGDARITEEVALETVTDEAGRPIDATVLVEDLEHVRLDSFSGAAAVTASALLDVVTRDEAARIVDACVAAGTPALFSLSVTGRVDLDPPEPFDAEISQAFNAHQRRDAGGRRMLGPDAVDTFAALFVAAGWSVRRAATPWRLDTAHARLIAEWLDGWVGAAVEQQPELAPEAAAYLVRRRAQAVAGVMGVQVGHEDVLAWPR
ncbi:SAM-dependent methyltransferase [Microbacterium panaciterrae]|uniref:SAM-dependent methyltransferase n=1 Tax=Microbacterium panaciterrae TaxID=985759 RepID=A0ABP8P915_9MICO